jgi:hypothetical protein
MSVPVSGRASRLAAALVATSSLAGACVAQPEAEAPEPPSHSGSGAAEAAAPATAAQVAQAIENGIAQATTVRDEEVAAEPSDPGQAEPAAGEDSGAPDEASGDGNADAVPQPTTQPTDRPPSQMRYGMVRDRANPPAPPEAPAAPSTE